MVGLTKHRLLENTEATLVAQHFLGSPVDQLYMSELEHLASGLLDREEIYSGVDYLEENNVVEEKEDPLGEVYSLTEEGRTLLEEYSFTNAEELLEKEYREKDRSDYFGPRH